MQATFTAVRTPTATYYDGPAGIAFGLNTVGRVISGTVTDEWQTDGGMQRPMTLIAYDFLGREFSVTGNSPLVLELPEFVVENELVFCLRPASLAVDAGVEMQVVHTLSWSFAYEGSAELEHLTTGCD